MSAGGGTAAVIFDCDGVLVHSEPVSNRVLAACLTDAGLPTTYEECLRDYLGRSLEHCIRTAAARHGRALPDDFAAIYLQRFAEAVAADLEPVAGVAAVLDDLDLPWCVASSGEHAKMRLTLGRTGLLGRCEGRLFSATELERGKPHPDLFLHAARQMGFDPPCCAVVEDSPAGAQAGRRAGMRVLGYAERTEPALLAAEGAEVFDDMRSLPGLLRS
jgi:HAD superfamily hydrolase (TIGR01509 family)